MINKIPISLYLYKHYNKETKNIQCNVSKEENPEMVGETVGDGSRCGKPPYR
jgi:hypothetical protein